MNVRISKELKKTYAPVFFLKNGANMEKHPFLKELDRKDADYLKIVVGKENDESFIRAVVMPSGKKAVVVVSKEGGMFPARKKIISARRIVLLARKEKIKEIAVSLDDFSGSGIGATEAAELIATQSVLANFEFNAYKTAPKKGWNFVDEVSIVCKDNGAIGKAVAGGTIIGEEINKARTLANTPGGDMTPQRLAEEAVKSGKKSGFKVKVLKENEIKKLGMGGVIGVSRGSAEKPRFIIMEYMKGARSEKPVVLVGKGVTFDTGGLNLKPSSYIYEMHMDMSGGAAVIHIIAALARLKVKRNIVGLIPAVENMPSGSSYHPGDLLKTMNGKTIEVMDTDAEGRVILADALEYSKKYDPKLVVDIATLTGAAEVALGQRASAIFSTDEKIGKELIEAGEKAGDYVWPLPLWDDYEEEIKGTFGDFANVGKTRYGGAITGAVFLWQFIKDSPSTGSGRTHSAPAWVHLDIAPRMTSIESDSLAKGAAGASIALLVRFLRNS